MKEDIHHRILEWLEGGLSTQERKDFEAEMRADPDLAREVTLVKDVLAAGHEPRVKLLRDQLDRIMSEEDNPSGPSKSHTHFFLWMAGLIMLVILIGWWYLNRPSTASGQEPLTPVALYQQYFEPLPQAIPATQNREGTKKGEEEVMERLKQINDSYAAGEWEQSLLLLRSLDVLDPEATYYRKSYRYRAEGVILLQLNLPEEALSSLEKAEAIQTLETVTWYKAGAFLLLGKKEAAISELETISASSPYYNNSQTILQHLQDR